MTFFNKIKRWFRQDQYYEVLDDFEQHNAVTFKKLDDEILIELVDRISLLSLSPKCSFPEQNMTQENGLNFEEINHLVIKIKEVIERDYLEIELGAKKNGYFSTYSITNLEIFPNAITITNTLEYPDKFDVGKVIYNLITIIKLQEYYCLWDTSVD